MIRPLPKPRPGVPIPRPRPNPKRLPKRKPMTVCVSAICEMGNAVVCATDGAISWGVTADCQAFKSRILGDWVFSFSGTYSNADLILQEISREIGPKFEDIDRQRIQQGVQSAYQHRLAQWLAFRHLAPFDMSMEDFLKDGKKAFGGAFPEELARLIKQDSDCFEESVLVAGFAPDHPLALLYEMDHRGLTSHSSTGFAAIGSGGQSAMSTLLAMEYGRHFPLNVALYVVAAAKFSAETSDGVGKSTAIVVRECDPSQTDRKISLKVVQPDVVDSLRSLWESHGKPRIPNERLNELKI